MKLFRQKGLDVALRSASEGLFINSALSKNHCYRTTWVSGCEVRVWGAESGRGLKRELLAGLRNTINKIGKELPLALMADHHPGGSGVIGTVAASSSRIVPEIIGGDCGCGVSVASLNISRQDLSRDKLERLLSSIRADIPLGNRQNNAIAPEVGDLPFWKALSESSILNAREIRKLYYQLGSLGGGNHFIELACDQQEQLYLLIHSGSRFLGGLLQEKYLSRNLSIEEEEGQLYLREQKLVVEFARLSRLEMQRRILSCLNRLALENEVHSIDLLDLGHNFIEQTEICSQPLLIHRKGACAAGDGQLSIIPGNMSVGSYLVRGEGNPASYNSSSHGAGRIFSRAEARGAISFKELRQEMKSVVWAESEKLKDEAPGAYKNLEQVIKAQRDLIRVKNRLWPLLSVKGEE